MSSSSWKCYLFETFENGRDASLTKNGTISIAVSDAITTLTWAWLSCGCNSMGKDVNKLLNLGGLAADHLFQIE